ncbi:hypothetical protein AOQ84DRAFT_290588 [Glonium stellatum]|uniref:Nucleoporin NUP49/NSP49 n=1 Tax=Glonium stellatum TaxID=574774 RepID=A0A8E2F3T1_9PEZI|nr:hypothetical protein AOQ84DRAFT_290588 [Glonium stellatum]
MAGFGRSNSLSINTGGSLFAGLFGTSTNTSQPQQTGGLFGQSTSQPQQPAQQSGGLFSQTTASQPQQSGGLFGNLQKPAQQQTGSLFGGSTTQSQPQQSSSLFGGTLGQQNQNQSQQSGGLFGNLGQQQKPATPSLFGSTTTQPKPSPLFGSSLQQPQQQQQQQQQPSLFSSMAQQNSQPNPFGGSLTLGQSNNQPQAFSGSTSTVPGVKIDVSNIRGTTRFSDLHESLQSQIEEIDKFIQQQINFCTQCSGILPNHSASVASIPPDVEFLEGRVATVELAIDNDTATVENLKKICRKDADDASLSFRAIENLKLPQQFHYAGMTGLSSAPSAPAGSSTNFSGTDDDSSSKPVDLVGYFSKRADGLGGTLDEYGNQIREIEAHLRTVEAGAMQRTEELMIARGGDTGSGRDQQRELVGALKAIEGAILQVAGKVGSVREMVVEETVGTRGR